MEDIFVAASLLGMVATASGGTFWLGKLNGRVSEIDRINNERHEHFCRALERIERKIDSLECNPEHGGLHDDH